MTHDPNDPAVAELLKRRKEANDAMDVALDALSRATRAIYAFRHALGDVGGIPEGFIDPRPVDPGSVKVIHAPSPGPDEPVDRIPVDFASVTPPRRRRWRR